MAALLALRVRRATFFRRKALARAMRQAFQRLLVEELTELQRGGLRGAFLRLDRDGDGALGLLDLGKEDSADVRHLLAVAGGQALGFSDFLAVMMPTIAVQDRDSEQSRR